MNNNYFIGKVSDDKCMFFAETLKDDNYYRIEFKILEDKLTVANVHSSKKEPCKINLKFKKNKVFLKDDKLEINMQAKLTFEDSSTTELSLHKIFTEKDVVESRYDRFDFVSDELKVYYIRSIIKSGEMYGKSSFVYDNSEALSDLIYHIDHKNIRVEKSYLSETIELEDSISLAQEFLNKMGYDINIKELINDNTIRIVDSLKKEGTKKIKRENGRSTYSKEEHRKIIKIEKNNNISFPAILIHEIMHHINLPDNGERTTASDYLTEGVSYAYEFLFLESLKGTKYENDCNKILSHEVETFAIGAYFAYYPINTINLYKEKENFTIEDIKSKANIEKYMKDMGIFIKDRMNLKEIVWHIIGHYIGFYIYMEYKDNASILTKLKEFNSSINEKSFSECLKIIDINGLQDVYGKVNSKVDELIEKYLAKDINDKSLKK